MRVASLVTAGLVLVTLGTASGTVAPAAPPDWAAVDSALGRPGAMQDGGVRRWSMPRSDLQVTAGGVRLRPAFALGAWLAMKPAAQGGVVAMGDLVLGEDELSPVLSRLQEGGVEQTAIHHHVMRESPRVLYVHVHGHGDPVAVARAVRAALALTGTPAPAPAAAPPPPLELDTAAVRAALGYAGRANGGVWQVSVPRAETIRDAGEVIPPSMGLATAFNFQPAGGGRAAITGDFVMTAREVNPVIAALRANGIEVVSLHNHLLAEEPRLFFMHFWADDDAVKLARGLRAALERTNSRRPGT
ncbi:MAG: DUF1259 domain-containing protein [Gemmatimonadaceae bacterium]